MLNLSSNNRLKKLQPGVFNCLERLETLLMKDISNLVIEKDAFIGLNSLRILDMSDFGTAFGQNSPVNSIYADAFDHMLKLEYI